MSTVGDFVGDDDVGAGGSVGNTVGDTVGDTVGIGVDGVGFKFRNPEISS